MRKGIYIVLVLAFAVDCSAQTLADFARRERERQKQLHSAVVVTNGVTTTTAASSSGTTPAVPSGPQALTTSAPKDNQGHDEKYWRDLFAKARAGVKAAEDRVQILDLKIKDLNTQLLRQSDMYNRENRLGPQIADTQKDLDGAHAQVEQSKKKLSDLDDDLRRAGGLPGWAR